MHAPRSAGARLRAVYILRYTSKCPLRHRRGRSFRILVIEADRRVASNQQVVYVSSKVGDELVVRPSVTELTTESFWSRVTLKTRFFFVLLYCREFFDSRLLIACRINDAGRESFDTLRSTRQRSFANSISSLDSVRSPTVFKRRALNSSDCQSSTCSAHHFITASISSPVRGMRSLSS